VEESRSGGLEEFRSYIINTFLHARFHRILQPEKGIVFIIKSLFPGNAIAGYLFLEGCQSIPTPRFLAKRECRLAF